jgi:hypothetical protein
MGALNVTVGFSTTNKLISRCIRWFTRSPCSHAWIAFDDEVLGLRVVLQAESWGYELRPWDRWRKENILVAEFIPHGPPLDKSLKWIATFLGSRYDYRAAFFAGLWRWFGRFLRGKFNSPSKLMCSEGVVRFLQHARYEAVADLDPEITSPKRLLIRCLQRIHDFTMTFALPHVLQRYGQWNAA